MIDLSLDKLRKIPALRRDGKQPSEHVLTLLDRTIAAVDQQLRALADCREKTLASRQEAVEAIGCQCVDLRGR